MKVLRLYLTVALISGFLTQSAAPASQLVLGKSASLKRTIIVSPGATDTESGANLKEALASVTGTSATPYLIKIEPGVYDLAGEYLSMKPYVDIEGSGKGVTVILSASEYRGVVNGSSNAEIRNLTIVNDAQGEATAYGIYMFGASPTIRNVGVEVSGGCNWPYGIYGYEASPEMAGVNVSVSGLGTSYGILIQYGDPLLKGIEVVASTDDTEDNVYGVRIEFSGSDVSPVRMENLRIATTNGANATGLSIWNSAVEADNVSCSARDGLQNNGIYIISAKLPVRISNSFTRASGGSEARAIALQNAAVVLSNVTAEATGATDFNVGLRAIGADSPLTAIIDHSRFEGREYGLYCSDLDYSFFVGSSKLDGPISRVGTWTCVHCYDGGHSALDNLCQSF